MVASSISEVYWNICFFRNLCAFYDVGAHNEMRLHGADWNDALDMAWENGESVAFTSAYAGNLKEIAALYPAVRAGDRL